MIVSCGINVLNKGYKSQECLPSKRFEQEIKLFTEKNKSLFKSTKCNYYKITDFPDKFRDDSTKCGVKYQFEFIDCSKLSIIEYHFDSAFISNNALVATCGEFLYPTNLDSFSYFRVSNIRGTRCIVLFIENAKDLTSEFKDTLSRLLLMCSQSKPI
jgi:hypothetical protein